MDGGSEMPPKQHMLTRDQAAVIVYHDLKENQRATFGVAAEYGRWLIASLILINGGAMWGLFSYLGSIGRQADNLTPFIPPIWSFAVGIALAMCSGLAAWANWSMHSENYRHMARFDMLWDPERWVDDPPHVGAITVTYWASLIAGIGSMAAALAGGAFILHGNFLAALTRLVFA